jgi:hypothetical protein
VVAAAAAMMAGLENFRPCHLDKSLLPQVLDYLPMTPYLAPGAIEKPDTSDSDIVINWETQRYPTGKPVNQIASANRCFNIALPWWLCKIAKGGG